MSLLKVVIEWGNSFDLADEPSLSPFLVGRLV
jgi:hypothetical protein